MVQKRATKVLHELKNKSYTGRLKMCNLPTLHFRRIRGDMIEVFKILTGKYDTAAAPVMDIYDLKTTRGNAFKLNKIRAKYDLRKYFFTNRVVNIWDSLPNYVITAESVNSFKSRFDKFWQHQELMYNYRSELHGTGSRSEFNWKFLCYEYVCESTVCEKQT